MAGTIRGKIEMLCNAGNGAPNANEVFKGYYDFLNSHPSTTLIALQHGNSGTGVDYHDGANPFGENAFAVFRFNTNGGRSWPWYLLLQYAESFTFGSSPGNPGLRNAGTGGVGSVAVQAAIGIGGTANPWNGTSNADGADTKGANVWAVPGGGGTAVHVFPRSNNTGGTHATNKQNCAGGYDSSNSNAVRTHIIADDDTLVMLYDADDDNTWGFTYCGLYTPHNGLTIAQPFAMLSNSAAAGARLTSGNLFGETSGSGDRQGGAVPPALYSAVGRMGFLRMYENNISGSTMQPNKMFSPGAFDEWPLGIYGDEATQQGFMGILDTAIITETIRLASSDTNTGQTRAGFSTTSLGAGIMVPWDGATTPGSGVSRAGITF